MPDARRAQWRAAQAMPNGARYHPFVTRSKIGTSSLKLKRMPPVREALKRLNSLVQPSEGIGYFEDPTHVTTGFSPDRRFTITNSLH